MPVIRVTMWEGRTREQKKALVAALTDEMARISGCRKEAVYVIFEDVAKDDWGVGGQLCSEKYPER